MGVSDVPPAAHPGGGSGRRRGGRRAGTALSSVPHSGPLPVRPAGAPDDDDVPMDCGVKGLLLRPAPAASEWPGR